MFDDVLAALRNPVEGFDYSVLADSLESQATTLAQGYEATITQRDASIATLNNESSVLKAHNYSLMMKANTSTTSVPNPTDPPDENAIRGINDLFS